MSLLISVKPKFVLALKEGRKTVELRAHTVKATPGQTVWIYTTHPAAKLEMCAVLSKVVYGTPAAIWRKYKELCGVTHKEYLDYVGSRTLMTALMLSQVYLLDNAFSLESLRNLEPGFHPPQGIRRVPDEGGLVRSLATERRKPILRA